jgi:hypothetical protein
MREWWKATVIYQAFLRSIFDVSEAPHLCECGKRAFGKAEHKPETYAQFAERELIAREYAKRRDTECR